MANKLTEKMKKQLIEMANYLDYLRNTNYKNNKLGREYADKQIRLILNDWDKKGIPRWKRNLLFDKVEHFIENDYYTKSMMFTDAKTILNNDF